jgi:hypothetical protein
MVTKTGGMKTRRAARRGVVLFDLQDGAAMPMSDSSYSTTPVRDETVRRRA